MVPKRKKQGHIPRSYTRRNFLKFGLGAASVGVLAPRSARALLTAAPVPNKASQAFSAFLADFTAHPQREEPTNLSAAALTAQSSSTRSMHDRLRTIDFNELNPGDRINYQFVESILIGREIVQDKIVPWKKDPRTYLQFRGLSRVLGQSGPADKRAQEVVKILQAIPDQLADGRRNLAAWVPNFRELSLFMADNAVPLFQNTVPAFAEQVLGQKANILAANAAAMSALTSFRTYLREELPKLPLADFAIGKTNYDAMLQGQYLLTNYNSDTLYEYGWQLWQSTVQELEAVARTIDPKKTWLELCAEIKEDGPDPMKEIEAHQRWVDKARAHLLEQSLIPIPWKERVDVVARPEYLRQTSYYGDTAVAKSPDADGVWVSQWELNTFVSTWDAAEKRRYIIEHDWGVIIDTAPHETYGGHHIQGLYQAHNPEKLRREFGISIFSEGWGLYNETLAQETGFFPNERTHLRQLQLLLWRVARVIWDVGIHTGKMSYDEAVSLLSDKVGFQRWAAQLEVDGSAQQPGYRIGYCMGHSEIIKMRQEFQQARGAAFTLSDFHERLLKVGNMPPKLMREGLMNSLKTT